LKRSDKVCGRETAVHLSKWKFYQLISKLWRKNWQWVIR